MIKLTFNQWLLIYKYAPIIALLNRVDIDKAVIIIVNNLNSFKTR